METPLLISSDELRGILLAQLPNIGPGLHIVDKMYHLLADDAWLVFMADVANQVQKALGPWQAESGDCDDYAEMQRTLARAANGKEAKRKGSIAVGVLSFPSIARNGNHAASVVVTTRKEGKHRLFTVCFFEPDSGVRLHLTAQEKNEAYRLLI
jgi:hypothetical protein